MSSNRRQHVVPQFYLRHFVGDDRVLHCLDKQTGKQFLTSPANIAHERDAFSITNGSARDDSFDSINNNVEKFSAPGLLGLREGKLDQPVLNAIGALSSNLILRSRTLRDQQLDQLRRIIEMMRTTPKNLTDSVQNDPALNMFGFKKWDPLSGADALETASQLMYPLSQLLLEEVAKRLSGRQLYVLYAPSERVFVTSDDPVCYLNNSEPFDSEQGHLALLDNENVEVLIPLLPTVACLWKHGTPQIQSETVTVDKCAYYNKMVGITAYQQIYASSEEVLKQVATSCAIEGSGGTAK